MPGTIVTCPIPGGEERATARIASPWRDGPSAEPETCGFACRVHSDPVSESAEQKPRPSYCATGEATGAIAAYER
jgi:hypothetical protein